MLHSNWYSDRDDRIDRIDGVQENYKGFKVGILIHDKAPCYADQVMIITTLNILARWCRNIIIEVSDFNFDLPLPFNGPSREVIDKVLVSSDPSVKVQFGSLLKSSIDAKLLLGSPEVADSSSFWIESVGWMAGCGKGPSHKIIKSIDLNRNIIGAVFAASLGNAALFRLANGMESETNYQIWYSLFDFEAATSFKGLKNPLLKTEIDLGIVHQVGCGAIGSSLSFMLGLTDWNFNISLIDFDEVKFQNCSSSLVFTYEDATQRKFKTKTCETLLLQLGKQNVRTFEIDYRRFLEDQASKADLILCLANENSIWSTIQNNYPPIVMHATTNKNWGTNFGRHLPLKEWCIMCRFESEVEANFVPIVCAARLATSSKDAFRSDG